MSRNEMAAGQPDEAVTSSSATIGLAAKCRWIATLPHAGIVASRYGMRRVANAIDRLTSSSERPVVRGP